jgi:hypothetical protein
MGVSASTFRLFVQGFDAAPSPYLDGVTATRSIERVLQPGNGAGQIQTVNGADYTHPAGGTVTLDLSTNEDVFGVALALDEMALLYIENASDGAGGVIELRPGAVAGFTSLLGTGSKIKLPKGCAVLLFLADFDQVDKWQLGAGNKALDIVETGGVNTAHVKLQVWGRK